MNAPLIAALTKARTALAAGQPGAAYDALLSTLDLAPRPHVGTEALLSFLYRQAPRARHAELDALWLRALAEIWARPADLALPVATYLAREPQLAAALDTGQWPATLTTQLEADPLFHALVRSTVIADARWERLLLGLSADAVQRGSQTTTPQLMETLALWAWLSERVALPPACTAAADTLLVAAGAGQSPTITAIAHAALSAPLVPSQWAAVLHRLPTGALVERLLRAPLREAELVAQWPLPAARDAAVAQHYEAAPYPRWLQEPLGLPIPLLPVVADTLARLKLVSAKVLIAGCGTGQQLFVAHDRYTGAELTALDVSRQSLAYAQRQCAEAGLTIAHWQCADLLDAEGESRSFAVVECIGVLHHLPDPAAGLRTLARLTLPGGVLHAAVYSRRARASVTALREQLLAQGHDLATLDVPALRRALRAGEHGALDPAILHSVDFYSVSGCRDLLLNARERVYDLPEFVAEAQAAGFDWLALAPLGSVAALATQHFGPPASTLSVAQWHDFEALHPQSFGGMFDVWLVRRA